MHQYPLLQTKMYIPPTRAELVSRPRLIERLNAGLGQNQGSGRKLTLISAPAGFGKTTLASEWVTGCERPAAWLSLDDGDNDPARFLVYVIAALQTLAPRPSFAGSIGEEALSLLQAPELPPTESILTVLLNDITTGLDEFILVLDDYHVIDAEPIDKALTFLLEHLPPQMHLVIATREDPYLPLSRLRARGQLTEVRVADLRFTPSEAAVFLNQVMGLNLSADDVTALEMRTEGWIAALQLAALALQGNPAAQGARAGQGTPSTRGREDVSGFIQAFAGDNRYIVDYLVEEVLRRQPEHVRSFLLQTSILDRLCGSLCDAVRFGFSETPSNSLGTGVRLGRVSSADRSVRAATATADAAQQDGTGMLAALERGNLFVVPLDDKRQWYRYHHLFADVLRAHLMKEQPEQIPVLHRRASEWYERNGMPSDAICHALAAKDFGRAADLAELAWPAWSGSYQSIAWLGWLKALPDSVVRDRPVLSVAYAWAYLNAGELEAAEARLVDAERWLEPMIDISDQAESLPSESPPSGMVVVDQAQFRSLPASLAAARAYHAQAVGDVAATVEYARRVLDLLPDGDSTLRGDATALLGLAYWASGDLEAAHRTFAEGLAGMKPLQVIVGTFVLAEIKTALGRLHEAVRACEHALQLAAEHGEPAPIGTEDVYTARAELRRELGDLEAAAQDLAASKRLGDQVELPDWQYRWCIAQARLKQTLGDLKGALDLLDEAERVYVRTPLPEIRPIAAMKARLWVAQGRLAEAQGWARERSLSAGDELSFLREFEHITLARALIARYRRDRVERSIHEAMGLLDRLLQAAEESRRMGSVIEIRVLQALAHEAQGDIPRAFDPLQRALAPAEPEGYVRIFVDEGPPMAALLKAAEKQGMTPNYARQLLAAFGQAEGSGPGTQPLIEPLSERELEVLGLVAQGLSNREICERLFLALNTVKGHNRNIYGKLGVRRRTEAVARARELGLL